MDFGANKTPVEVIKGGAFGGRYFKDIYSRDTGKWYRKSWKEFGFSGILDTGWVEALQMMRDKLIDEKKLLVDLKGN